MEQYIKDIKWNKKLIANFDIQKLFINLVKNYVQNISFNIPIY